MIDGYAHIITPAIKYVISAVAKWRAGIYNLLYFLDSRFRGNDRGTSEFRLFSCHVNRCEVIRTCFFRYAEDKMPVRNPFQKMYLYSSYDRSRSRHILPRHG